MTGIRRGAIALCICSLAMLVGCRKKGRTVPVDTTAAGRHQAGSLEGVATPSAADTSLTPGIGPSSSVAATQYALKTEMRAIDRSNGDQLLAMVPRHRQLVATMLAQMDTGMGSRGGGASAEWRATRDSVSGDLMRFSGISARDIQAMMPRHEARVSRLMAMQRGMMQGMGRMMPNP